jgi:hypothetical protein
MQLDVAVVVLAYISRVLGAKDTEVFGTSCVRVTATLKLP